MSGQIVPIIAGLIGVWLMKSPLDKGGVIDWIRGILSEAKEAAAASSPPALPLKASGDDAIAHFRGLKSFLETAGKKEAIAMMQKDIWPHLG